MRVGRVLVPFVAAIASLGTSARAQEWWSAPTDLGGVALKSGAAPVANGQHRLDVFYRGPNDHLWVSWWDGGQWWSPPTDLGGVALTSDPVAVAGGSHKLDVFYRGPNNHLWTSWWPAKADGQWWSAPTDLGGEAITSGVAAIVNAKHRIDLFYRGSNNHLWTSWWPDEVGSQWWSAPTDLGGESITSTPAAVGSSRHQIDLFYRGPNNHLWTSWWPDKVGSQWWSAPADLGGVSLSSAPAVVAKGSHSIDVFYSGPNNHLWTSWWPNVASGQWWSAPTDLGGVAIASPPGAVAATRNKLDVFYRGPNDHLWTSWWPSGGQNPPPPVEVWKDTHTGQLVSNPAPYDVVTRAYDDNGFPLNPMWGKQYRYYRSGAFASRPDLLGSDARPDIYKDCFDHVDRQNCISVVNDYNPFQNGYCIHSPGATHFDPFYCGNASAPAQPGGAVYCSSWSWKDQPWLFKCGECTGISGSPFTAPFHNDGHENFAVVTYEGIARWDNAQPEYFYDYDWCVDLFTPMGAGVSSQTPSPEYSFIHTEMNPKEVGDHFDRGFWKTFRDRIHDAEGGKCCGDNGGFRYSGAVTNAENCTVAPIIDGKRAVVTGLLALDMGHDDAGSELHPVYGMAIHTGGRALAGSGCSWSGGAQCAGSCSKNTDVYLHPERDAHFDAPENPDDDTWAVWMSNFGSAGYCSSGSAQTLDGASSVIGRKDFPRMTMRIPWAKDADSHEYADVEVLASTSFWLSHRTDVPVPENAYEYFVDRGSKKGIVITFHMSSSDVRPVYFGELHLKWKR